MKNFIPLSILALSVFCFSCKTKTETKKEDTAMVTVQQMTDTVQTALGPLVLPKPYATESVSNGNSMAKWPDGKMPTIPTGFTVTKYAEDFKNPRQTYVAPNGDLFVVESGKSANRITLIRDMNYDGKFEVRETFLDNLNKPYGVVIIGNYFYVANQDGVLKYPYKEGQTSLKEAKGIQIVDLPAGGYNHHWTRNLISGPEKDKIYISVGSASNVGEYGMEKEIRRANILVVDLDGKNEKVLASGLRNPVGMDWNPVTGELWTAVNERDELGDNLVPDYVTSVKDGGFYGWPYSYYGQLLDPRLDGKGKDLVAKAIVPDVSVGPHTASLGLAFYTKDSFPSKYKNGAFIGQHGSWNRSTLSGYKVVFMPFKDGKPSGQPEDFLTGFVADENSSTVYGRPVGVCMLPNGDLLVNDDSGNALWKVTYIKQ